MWKFHIIVSMRDSPLLSSYQPVSIILFIVKKEAHVVFLFKFVIQRYICIIGQFTILLQI